MENKQKNPIVKDPVAAEILSQIDYNFNKFEKSRHSQLGVSVRTMLLNDAVRDFIARHSRAVVVNLGAGLDTRHQRLGLTGDTDWYELDLPVVVDLRREFFQETATCFDVEVDRLTFWAHGGNFDPCFVGPGNFTPIRDSGI